MCWLLGRCACTCPPHLSPHTRPSTLFTTFPHLQVEAAITAALTSDNEDAKSAASLALGGVVCGNLTRYLPR